MGTAISRLQTLRDNVGNGHLVGHVKVDQRYAADQHFHEEYRHPDGGKANYLRDPHFAKVSENMQKLGDGLLEQDGNGLADAMMDSMENVSSGVYMEAPWEFGDLRGSGHPSVRHNGYLVHDRAPRVARLSDEELREKSNLSRLFNPDRYL